MQAFKAVTLFLFLSLFTSGWSQVAPDQDYLIRTELDKRGLTQVEAEQALMAKGLDVQKMSPETLLAKKSEITAVLDELAAAKSKQVEQVQEEKMDSVPVPEEVDLPTQRNPFRLMWHQMSVQWYKQRILNQYCQ